MSEVVVVATLTAEPGREAEAEEALRAIVEPAHAEAGCLLFSLHHSKDDPRRFCLIERWASQEELDVHHNAPRVKEGIEQMLELFGEGVDIAFYDALPVGAPAQGSLAGNAAAGGR